MLPTAVIFVRNKPEDIGQLPDGEKNNPKESVDKSKQNEQAWTLKEAMRTRAFWLLLFCVTIPAALNTGFTFHLASIVDYLGFTGDTAMLAASILSVYAITQFFSNFIAGIVGDKYKDNIILAFTFVGFFCYNIYVSCNNVF